MLSRNIGLVPLLWWLSMGVSAQDQQRSVGPNPNFVGLGTGEYRALLMGIDSYPDQSFTKLKTPVADCEALKQVLEGTYGFTRTITLYNQDLTKRSLLATFKQLKGELKPEDSLLIYFAGHGEQDKNFNSGWWLLADAVAQDEVSYLENETVLKYLGGLDARHILLLSDSCFAGTLLPATKRVSPVIDDHFLQQQNTLKSRWGMTAGGNEPVLDGGGGGHSIFARQVINYLTQAAQPYFTVMDIYTRIRPAITRNSEQKPLCDAFRNIGDDTGYFVFVKHDAIKPNIIVHKYGRLKVSSSVAGTLVLDRKIRERLEPNQVCEIGDLLPGDHELSFVTTIHYEKIEEKIRVVAGEIVSRDYEPKPARSFTSPSTGMVLIWIQPGTFWMGSPENEPERLANEKRHKVTLTQGFGLSRYEVTQAEYKRVMGTNPSSFMGDQNPVHLVNWNEAQQFCQKLTALDRAELPSGYGHGLPTEAQWEYAARSGTQTGYPFGTDAKDLDKYSWRWYNSGKKTHQVGGLTANAWGLYDMIGNVAEWCADWYGEYGSGPDVDPAGTDRGDQRVVRGGHLFDEDKRCRSASRSSRQPGRYLSTGFRVALIQVQPGPGDKAKARKP